MNLAEPSTRTAIIRSSNNHKTLAIGMDTPISNGTTNQLSPVGHFLEQEFWSRH